MIQMKKDGVEITYEDIFDEVITMIIGVSLFIQQSESRLKSTFLIFVFQVKQYFQFSRAVKPAHSQFASLC